MSEDDLRDFKAKIDGLSSVVSFVRMVGGILLCLVSAIIGGAAWIWNTNTQLQAQSVELTKTNMSVQIFVAEVRSSQKENADAHRKYEELLSRLTAITEMQQKQLDKPYRQ